MGAGAGRAGDLPPRGEEADVARGGRESFLASGGAAGRGPAAAASPGSDAPAARQTPGGARGLWGASLVCGEARPLRSPVLWALMRPPALAASFCALLPPAPAPSSRPPAPGQAPLSPGPPGGPAPGPRLLKGVRAARAPQAPTALLVMCT